MQFSFWLTMLSLLSNMLPHAIASVEADIAKVGADHGHPLTQIKDVLTGVNDLISQPQVGAAVDAVQSARHGGR